MKRLQISIEPELDAAVENRAARDGVSKAEVIRRCVRSEIAEIPAPADDPFWQAFGMIDEGGHRDDSVNVDEIIYGARDPAE